MSICNGAFIKRGQSKNPNAAFYSLAAHLNTSLEELCPPMLFLLKSIARLAGCSPYAFEYLVKCPAL
jgi:hypothetical protein